MRPRALLLLLALPSTALAEDGGGVRFTDVLVWVTLLAMLLAGGLAWMRGRAWMGANLLPALEGFYRTAHPPRLRVWLPGGAQPPALLGERWLALGGLHWVRAVAADVVPRLVAELLTQPGCVVAVHGGLAEVSLDQALLPLGGQAVGRVFVCPDPPSEATFAAMSTRGGPLVLILEKAPSAELAASIARWGAIALIVSPDNPGVPNLAGTRRAS